jgi:hypothetical protein
MSELIVRVEIGHQLARITPVDVEALLAEELSYTEHRFQTGGRHGYQLQSQRPLLVRRDDAGGLLIPSGLAAAAQELLTAAGWQVAVTDHRQLGPLLQPDPLVLADVHPDNQALLNAILEEPRRLLMMADPIDWFRLPSLLCKVLPRARTLLALNASRRDLARLRGNLQQAARLPVSLFADYTWPLEGGRLLCSLQDLQMHNGQFDMVIVLDAVQALSPAYCNAIAGLRWQRVYGLVPPERQLRPATRLLLESRFGPLFRVPDPEMTQAAVQVWWAEPPWMPDIGPADALQRKRALYWHNAARNDRLAAIVSAIATANEPALASAGLVLGGSTLLSALGKWPGVTIVVESTEHAGELLRRLDGWELRSMQPGTIKSAARRPFLVRQLDKLVVTYAAASRLKTVDTDVLIWAGADYPPELPGFPPPDSEMAERVVLIDLADDADAAARAAVQRRFQEYHKRGWTSMQAPRWARQRDGGAGLAGRQGR